jgi:hypothetical protein
VRILLSFGIGRRQATATQSCVATAIAAEPREREATAPVTAWIRSAPEIRPNARRPVAREKRSAEGAGGNEKGRDSHTPLSTWTWMSDPVS